MSFLFRPFQLGPMALRNRLVAVPVFTGYALPNGRVSAMLLDHYRRLAETGVAMVVVANAAVSEDGCTSAHNLRADRDEDVGGLRELADTIRQGGAGACLQLNHAGRFARCDRPLLPTAVTGRHLSFNLSSLTDFIRFFPLEKRFALTQRMLSLVNRWVAGMSDDEMQRVATDFALAAQRGWRAGFDCVEIHGASGYLLNQFLSAFTNRRGFAVHDDLADRMRFPLQVLKSVKQALPEHFPVGFRLQLREWVPDGIDLNEAIAWATCLQEEGIAYLSVSAGSYHSYFSADFKTLTTRPAYLREDTTVLKTRVRTPVIMSGRICEPLIAEQLLDQGVTDLIGLGRPLRTDVHWLDKAQKGVAVRTCVNCNSCLKRVTLDQGFVCARWPTWEKERTVLDHKLLKRGLDRQLWVITAPEDLGRFSCLPDHFVAPRPARQVHVLRLSSTESDRRTDGDDVFMAWLTSVWRREAIQLPEFSYPAARVSGNLTGEMADTVNRGAYGLIMLAREQGASWQGRLMSRVKGKVICLAGAGAKSFRMLVALDLSDASLLVLKCLDRLMAHRPDMAFDCVHILRGTSQAAETTWKRMKKILGSERRFDLDAISSSEDVAAVLLRKIRDGGYTVVVMGKRGLSGIKRRILGSVSAKVLQGLDEETLLLID